MFPLAYVAATSQCQPNAMRLQRKPIVGVLDPRYNTAVQKITRIRHLPGARDEKHSSESGVAQAAVSSNPAMIHPNLIIQNSQSTPNR